MSADNVEILRRAFPESGPGDIEALLSILDEDVEWDYLGAFPEIRTAHGPAEVREFLRGWSGAFDDFGIEAEEMIEAGDSVAALVRQWGRGKETGAETQNRTWQLFTFRDGRIIHCHGYETRAEALEAAGD